MTASRHGRAGRDTKLKAAMPTRRPARYWTRSVLRLAVLLIVVPLAAGAIWALGSPNGTRDSATIVSAVTTVTPSPDLATPTAKPIPSATPSASEAPAATRDAIPTATPTPYLPAPFAMDIYRRGTFVSQIDKHHCMSAALQNMLDLIGPTVDRSAARQKRISTLALRLSTDTLDHSWGPQGWADGLTQLGAGQYKVRIYTTRAAALKAAVTALRTTGRPVGILAWWGAHSWVLSGFRASADPAYTTKFTVSGYNIVDPWYPRISTIWGAAKAPDTLRSPAEMVYNLPAWTRPEGHYPGRDGKWLLVLPIGSDVPLLHGTAAPAAG